MFLFIMRNSIAQSVHEDSIKIYISTVAQKIDDSIHIKIIKTEYENIFEFQVDPLKLSLLQKEVIEKMRIHYITENKNLENKFFAKTTIMELKTDFLKTK